MMIVTAWLVYCVLIAGMLTLGAAAWERSARWSGRPARWGWLAALAGSVTLPWVLRLVPARGWADAVPAAATVLRLDPLVMSAGDAPAAVWSASEMGIAAWIAMSGVMLLYVGVLFARLVRLSRRWRVAELEGGPVLLTRAIGPAALGIRRGMVVLPAWVMDLDAELRSLLLRHERAHVEAGDPRLLLGGLVLLAAMPWNPVAWLQVLRLRNAIELDCDARVLSAGADPTRYGALLLEVGRRRSSHALVMATFAEPRVFMEQRIRRIAQWPLERRRGRAAAFATAALFLFVTTLSARDPLHAPPELTGDDSGGAARISDMVAIPLSGGQSPFAEAGRERSAADPAAARDAVAAAAAGTGSAAAAAAAVQPRPAGDLLAVTDTPPPTPVFTPMTRAPELRNRAEVQAALERNYPPLLRGAGIGGTPTVHIFIDTLGVVRHTLISRTSSYPALDEAAISVARTMEFTSAYNRGERVEVWVEIPVVFRASGSAPARRPARRPQPLGERVSPQRTPAPTAAAGQERQATEFDVAPELTNRNEVARALVRAYPPLLRDAGIGGSAAVWFMIDEQGTVRDTELAASTGYPALDMAALKVAETMRFTPAQVNGRPIAAWVQIPIVFTAH